MGIRNKFTPGESRTGGYTGVDWTMLLKSITCDKNPPCLTITSIQKAENLLNSPPYFFHPKDSTS